MRWRLAILLMVELIPALAVAADVLDSGLVGHWKLAGDVRDSSGRNNHGAAKHVEFTVSPDGSPGSAVLLNGRNAFVEVPNSESLQFGRQDFSVSVWVKPESKMTTVFGDILSKFDGAKRRGINFHIAGSSSGYTSMCDTRHVHFGIDDGYLSEWKDCGKPWPTNSLITNLVVFEGELYAGIADAARPEDACRVFRWQEKRWIDCGRLGQDPQHLSVFSLFVHNGRLYGGTGIWDWDRAWGVYEKEGKPRAAKPRVFVYEGGTKWRDLGVLGDSATRVLCMASYNGELYAGIDKYRTAKGIVVPGRCFKHDGKAWIDCGAPDQQNLENLYPLGGRLYCATHGNAYVYEGGQQWAQIAKFPFEITQIHSMEAYRGQLHLGTWPQGYVLRQAPNGTWTNTGRLGLPVGKPEINEINDLCVHNGKLYAGVIPQAEVYRYEADGRWTLLKSLGRQPNLSRTVTASWSRVTAMTSFQGKLYAGTGSCEGMSDDQDPDDTLGRVYEIQAGHVVSHERDIGNNWTHLAAVRRGSELKLFTNGVLSVTSHAPDQRVFDLSNSEPLLIGFGAQTYFSGALSDLRLYGKALTDADVRRLADKPTRNPNTR